jgi:hypothetical protein
MTKDKATATNYDGLWGRQIKAEAQRKQRMKEPTPRPWAWLPNEGQLIVDKDRNIVAEVPCTSGNPADGAYIVTAVNERDRLLAEVARSREALDSCEAAMSAAIPYVPRDLEIALRERVKAARAALSSDKE